MDTTSTDVFAFAEKRLAWIGQRQGILAQNIANVNTPSYVAQDVKPFSAVLAAQTQQTAVAGSDAASTLIATPSSASATGRSLDGNAVVLDEQLEKVAETDTAHQLATNLYKKYESLFRTAIGRN